MHCFSFHLMPWDRLAADFGSKYESAWTWLPNSLYDPPHGHELYNRYLDELVLADELGFDGVCVNEHPQNAYGTMASPNLMGAILARQTKRVKIAVIGNALPLYNPVTRVAEEFAMIDVIRGGRPISGLLSDEDRRHQRRRPDPRPRCRRRPRVLQLLDEPDQCPGHVPGRHVPRAPRLD